jgi:hypothetical protein
MRYKIFLALICSQLLFLWVLALSESSYIVLHTNKNLCWEFIKWTTNNPNWLPEWWKTLDQDQELYESSFATLECSNDNIWSCCKALWYRFAWVLIWVSEVSSARNWAEFLARKWFIERNSFAPSNYKLESNISRKELMKIIIWISWVELNNFCREIFRDVWDDWGCKYIETALDNWYIEWRQAFRPEEFVTKTEALKLIFKARNILKRYNTAYWQQDYVSTAYYLWYINTKFSDYNTYITRWEIFTIIERTYK